MRSPVPMSSFFAGPKRRHDSKASEPSVRPGSSWSGESLAAPVLRRSPRGLDPAPGGRGRPPGARRHARRPRRPGGVGADGRRRRVAALSGPVGHAVAGRARARGRARRPVRRGGRAGTRSYGGRGPAAAPPGTRSTCTCCGSGGASRRSGSRCAPCAPVVTSSRKSRATPATAPEPAIRRANLAPCASGWTRAGPSPTWSATTARSSRCRRRPTIPASRSAPRSRRSPRTRPSCWRTGRRWRPTRCSSASSAASPS